MSGPAIVVWSASAVLSLLLLAAPLVVDAASFAVSIKDFAFAPQTITVNVGDGVRWTNNESTAITHTATADNGSFTTGLLASGQSAAVTFSSAGTFPYHCAVHPSMRGTVTVSGPSPTTPPPPPPPPTTPPPPPPQSTPPRTAPPPPPSTSAPTAAPTTQAPSATPAATASPSPVAASTTSAPSRSPVAVASPGAAASPAPAPADNGPLLAGAAALAIVGAGALAWWLRRPR